MTLLTIRSHLVIELTPTEQWLALPIDVNDLISQKPHHWIAFNQHWIFKIY